MDFKSLCEARYSVRAYKPDAIPVTIQRTR